MGKVIRQAFGSTVGEWVFGEGWVTEFPDKNEGYAGGYQIIVRAELNNDGDPYVGITVIP